MTIKWVNEDSSEQRIQSSPEQVNKNEKQSKNIFFASVLRQKVIKSSNLLHWACRTMQPEAHFKLRGKYYFIFYLFIFYLFLFIYFYLFINYFSVYIKVS